MFLLEANRSIFLLALGRNIEEFLFFEGTVVGFLGC